ncbi:MAG TPA: cell division protein FtsA [Rummeliibacillus sp.]|nr:cell division protein FtsA [Rummeliibacillus sp.]
MNHSELYVSLDIGSSSVKVLIGEVNDETVHVIGVGNVKSTGIRRGSIVDIDATVQSIKKAIDQAERMVGMSIHKVILGIPANQVQLHAVKGVVAVNSENREITDVDLDRVIESAQLMSIPPDRELVNIVPIQYIVDGLDGINDPRGMIGIRLEMDGTMITTSKTVLHNVLRCVEKAGLEIQQIYLQPLASGEFALTEDDRNRGTAFIDIGGGSTTIAVFKDGHFLHTAMIPVGGEHITKDLSIVLKTPTEQAEKIKTEFGHAYYDDASDDELFEVPVIGADTKEQFSQRYISEIIGVRLEELFDLIIDELYRIGIQDLPGGVVLTGGVAKLEGLPQLARHVLQTSVKIYVPDYIGVRDPEYTAAVNLIRYAYKESQFNRDVIDNVPLVPAGREDHHVEQQKSTSIFESQEHRDGVLTKVKGFFNRFLE